MSNQSSPARFPMIGGMDKGVEQALKRKRAWEDESVDDLELDLESVSVGHRSVASYTTRRKKAWRENQRAGARATARERYRPEFDHIRVEMGAFFYRHFNPAWKFADPDPWVVQFLATGYQLPVPVDLERLTMTQPCDAAQMAHLVYFDRIARPRPSTNHRAYEAARKRVAALLALDAKLSFPHAEDMESVRYKPRKYPGNEYRMMGFQTRAEAHPAALVDANLAWAQLMAGEYVAPHCVRLGGRGKLADATREELLAAGKPKGRLILMLSQRDLLLLGNVENLLTDAYKDPDYPMAIGMGWFGGNVTTFAERLIPLGKYFCMDAEKYDGALDPWLLGDGVDILRNQFVDGDNPRYDKYWEFVLETLIGPPIARDDGWIMYKEVGSTSGHSFNTLVQSVCTLLVGYAALFSLVPEGQWDKLWDEVEMDSLGDDNVTGLPDWLSWITADMYGDAVETMTGINWKGSKSFGTRRLVDDEEPETPGTEEGWFQGVQYLGKFLRLITLPGEGPTTKAVVPYRPFKETLARVYYPERSNGTIERAYQRTMGNLLDAYGNPHAAHFLNAFLDWMEGQMAMPPVTWDEDTVQDAARDYTSAQVVVPRMRRWSLEEWLVLTLTPPGEVPDMYELV